MKSIRTKILLLILSSILITVLVIGGTGIVTVNNLVNNESQEVMNLICKTNALELNTTFTCIEHSVETLAVYATDHLDDIKRIQTDSDYVDEYTYELQEVAINAANNTIGAIAVYIRFNPEFTSSTSGLFWSRTANSETFNEQKPTDISLFDPNDVEHVGWYYMPTNEKQAMWMPPYYNQNINVPMISYVIPIYVDDILLGVVGMDIDYNVIIEKINTMKIYDSGYAFLIDDQNIIMYHPTHERGTKLADIAKNFAGIDISSLNSRNENEMYYYESYNEEKVIVLNSLKNGMTLVLTAPEKEIKHDQYLLIQTIVIAAILIYAICLFTTFMVTNKIIKPLIELNVAAQKIADGDLSINLTYKTNDEIGELTDSFNKTADSLRQYHSYINNLAYIDSLTGIKNKTAYQKFADKMDIKIAEKNATFALAVFDVNNLKYINDTFGHEEGDKLLKNASTAICFGFKHSPVFRIGGDEFVAILENSDYENRDELIADFNEKMKYTTDNITADNVSIACGCAVFDKEQDSDMCSVFRRADQAMYIQKQEMKELDDISLI